MSQSTDPTFGKDGNAAIGQFYSSGGQNDSTGREPFEDSIKKAFHHGTGSGAGSYGVSGSNLSGGNSTSDCSCGENCQNCSGSSCTCSSCKCASCKNNITSRSGASGLGGSGLTGTGAGMGLGGGNSGIATSREPGHAHGYGETGKDDALSYQQGGGLGANEKQFAGMGLGERTGAGAGSGVGSGVGSGGVGAGAAGLGAAGVGAGVAEHEHHHHGHHGHHGVGKEAGVEQEFGRGQVGSDGLHQTSNTGIGQASAFQSGETHTAGHGHHHHHHHDATSGVGAGVGTATGGADAYGSNTAAEQYKSDTSGLPHDQKTSTGLQGSQNDTTREGTSGFASTTNPGSGGNSGLTSGATGTDRFGQSGGTEGVEYGHPALEKKTTNQGIGRHGDDFTGGFAATGGAYVNDSAATGLTGRETTATGVQDRFGEPTQHQSLLTKVKNAMGGHKNDANAGATDETAANDKVN